MVIGLGEERWPEIGMRLPLSPVYSDWIRGDMCVLGCGTTLAKSEQSKQFRASLFTLQSTDIMPPGSYFQPCKYSSYLFESMKSIRVAQYWKKCHCDILLFFCIYIAIWKQFQQMTCIALFRERLGWFCKGVHLNNKKSLKMTFTLNTFLIAN